MEKRMKLIVKTKGNRTKYWIFIIYAWIILILFVEGKAKNKTKQNKSCKGSNTRKIGHRFEWNNIEYGGILLVVSNLEPFPSIVMFAV